MGATRSTSPLAKVFWGAARIRNLARSVKMTFAVAPGHWMKTSLSAYQGWSHDFMDRKSAHFG